MTHHFDIAVWENWRHKNFFRNFLKFLDKKQMYLQKFGISETGAYGVPSKSQNLNVLGQGGSPST